MNGGEIAFGRDRETGLDDIDAHRVEQFGDFELLLVRHGGAGALLAVAQGGVENDDAVLFGLGWRGHGLVLFSLRPPNSVRDLWALVGFRCCGRPLSAQA